MIAVVDIGNTRTKAALFREDGTLAEEGILRTGDNMLALAAGLFPGSIERAVIGSVVPALTRAWADYLVGKAGILHVAGHDSPWGFRVAVEKPETLGVDRLANLEGALSFPGSVLVVDAGTATKFDLLEGVGDRRSFPGGAIAPGLMLGYEALLAKTALLKEVDLKKHSPAVGYDTETAIRSGVLHGFAAQVDGMVARILDERQAPRPWTVVATGGNSSYLMGRAQLITHNRPRLTMEGLYALAKKV